MIKDHLKGYGEQSPILNKRYYGLFDEACCGKTCAFRRRCSRMLTDSGVECRVSAADDHWLTRFSAPDKTRLRLLCVPHSGASGFVFRCWADHLPEEVELYGVHLPGRVHRLREPCLRNLGLAAKTMAQVFRPIFAEPFALFGHSLGASLVYELCHEISEHERSNLRGLYVSGTPAPHVQRRHGSYHRLSDEELKRQLQAYEGTSVEILGNEELMELSLPIIRSDLEMGEMWTSPPRHPLECPLYCYGGIADPETWSSELDAWRAYTSVSFRRRLYQGGHFYMLEDPQFFTQFSADLLDIL